MSDLFLCQLLAKRGLTVGNEVKRHLDVCHGRWQRLGLLYFRAVRTPPPGTIRRGTMDGVNALTRWARAAVLLDVAKLRPSRRDPRREKDLDYERQTRSRAHSGLRHHWLARKAADHRAYRSRWSTYLAQAGSSGDPEVVEAAELKGLRVRRGHTENWAGEPYVAHAMEHAAHRLVARIDAYRSTAYDPAAHREALINAISALISLRPRRRGQRIYYSAGETLNALLPTPFLTVGHYKWRPDRNVWDARRQWFTAFMHDQPQWERRLTAWVRDEHRRLLNQ